MKRISTIFGTWVCLYLNPMKKVGLACLFVLILAGAKSQDTVKFTILNGEVLHLPVTGEDSVAFFYDEVKRKRIVNRKLYKDVIYAVQYEGKPEVLMYKQDSASGNYLSAVQMSNYIQGVQLANRERKALGYTIIGGLAGAASGFYLFNSFAAIGMPLAITGVAAIPNSAPKNNEHPLFRNEFFRLGYEKRMRSKRVFNVLRSSILGVIGGVVLGNQF